MSSIIKAWQRLSKNGTNCGGIYHETAICLSSADASEAAKAAPATYNRQCNLRLLIWGNSLQPAEASSAFSTGVLSKLQPLWFQLTNSSFPLSHQLLRKLGHFSEFFLLGLVSTLTGAIGHKKLTSSLPVILYIGLAVAVVDETIQYFSPGRSPEVRDILIDYSGFCCGLLAALGLYKLLSAMYQGLTR